MEAQGARNSDRVVRPIAAAGGRTCARPGCPAPARSTLTFAYEAKQVKLVALLPEADPASYDLCGGHADRTSPPAGWTLADERPPEPDGTPLNLSDEDRTVAVISAALRAVPTLPDEPAPGTSASDEPVEPNPDASSEGHAPQPPRARREPRPVLAARGHEDAPRGAERAATPDADEDVRALAAAAEVLAGAEVEVALEELHDLAELGSEAVAGPAPLTLPFNDDGSHDDDREDDAPLSADGHAQVW